MKIRPEGAELFHTDGKTGGRMDRQTDRLTDMMKFIVSFCIFATAPNNGPRCHFCSSYPALQGYSLFLRKKCPPLSRTS